MRVNDANLIGNRLRHVGCLQISTNAGGNETVLAPDIRQSGNPAEYIPRSER
jgi:hypothetical protein